MKPKRVSVHDHMQKRYHYTLTAPIGRAFAPDFAHDLTPKEMLALGVFGGTYLTDCTKEFPRSWFTRAKLSPKKKNIELNCFGVGASQPLAIWKAKGWIHRDDPRGWFQWYCRHYMGRRGPDDARQIKRWRAMTRHIAQIRQKAGLVTSTATASNGKHSFIGHMIAGYFRSSGAS